MDASAYLSRQGWRGDGHSLHPTGRGIKKPLLISKKSNTLGVGKQKHANVTNEWWSKAFDTALHNLELEKNQKTGETEAVKKGTWDTLDLMKAGGGMWAQNGGLYAGFIRGASLKGTLTLEPDEENSLRGQREESEETGVELLIRSSGLGEKLPTHKAVGGMSADLDEAKPKEVKHKKKKHKMKAEVVTTVPEGEEIALADVIDPTKQRTVDDLGKETQCHRREQRRASKADLLLRDGEAEKPSSETRPRKKKRRRDDSGSKCDRLNYENRDSSWRIG